MQNQNLRFERAKQPLYPRNDVNPGDRPWSVPVRLAPHRLPAPGSRRPRARRVVLALAFTHLLAGAGPAAQRIRQADSPAIGESLASWSRRNEVNRWPASNVGDPNLRGVAFLYDLAITAQARLAADDRDGAVALIRRVESDWPRAHGIFVDSYKIVEGIPFDQIEGNPRATNGPNMHLALSSLTIWAAGGKSDEDLLRLAREVAGSVRAQIDAVDEGGAVPYGPGEQRFPDGVSFRQIFNPEYQIDAYALFDRLARATGDRSWRESADRVLDWLMVNRYDRDRHAFWAADDQGRRGYPPDVPGWALSMIGPEALAGAGIDVEGVAADASRLPDGVVVTEWLVNRLNGLERGADYLDASGRARAAEQARVASGRLRALLANLPIQPAAAGGGLAYAYRVQGGGLPGPGALWESAEGVPTGWGWNTQRGSSRIAVDYALSSLFLDHDPVAGSLRGVPIDWSAPDADPPDAADVPPVPAGGEPAGAAPPALADPPAEQHEGDHRADERAPNEVKSYRYANTLNEYDRGRRLAIAGLMLSDPLYDPILENDRPPVFLEAGDGRIRPGLPRLENPFQSIDLERRVLEGERVRIGGSVAMIAPGRPDFGVLPLPHSIRITLDGDLNIDRRFATPLETDLEAINHPPRESRSITVPSANFVTLDPGRGEVTGVYWRLTNDLGLAFKRPLSPEEWARRPDPGLIVRFEEDGQRFEWSKTPDPERLLAVDARLYRNLPPTDPAELARGDRVLIGSAQAKFQVQTLRANAGLAARGYLDGMAIGPRPSSANVIGQVLSYPPGWISLRPRIVGERTAQWPYLREIASARERADDPMLIQRLDQVYGRGQLILDWLADVEAILKFGTSKAVAEEQVAPLLEVVERARENVWEAPDGVDLLVVGRSACEAARAELDEIGLRGDAPGARAALSRAIRFAEETGLDAVEPRRSTYERVFLQYRKHLDRRLAAIRDLTARALNERDPGRRRSLEAEREVERRLFLQEVETMSFRDGDTFFALIPGVREAEARLALVEELENIPEDRRIARELDTQRRALVMSVLDPNDDSLWPSRVEQHRRYERVFGEEGTDSLVEVSTEGGHLVGYDIRDFAGRLVGRLSGEIEVNGRAAEGPVGRLGPGDRIRADLASGPRFEAGPRPVGEELIPISGWGALRVSELASRIREHLLTGADEEGPESPILRTRLDPERPGTVVVTTRGGRESYTDRYQIGTADHADTYLIERDYGGGNFERYSEHTFLESEARWIPTRVEIFIEGNLRERRALEQSDDRGRTTSTAAGKSCLRHPFG